MGKHRMWMFGAGLAFLSLFFSVHADSQISEFPVNSPSLIYGDIQITTRGTIEIPKPSSGHPKSSCDPFCIIQPEGTIEWNFYVFRENVDGRYATFNPLTNPFTDSFTSPAEALVHAISGDVRTGVALRLKPLHIFDGHGQVARIVYEAEPGEWALSMKGYTATQRTLAKVLNLALAGLQRGSGSHLPDSFVRPLSRSDTQGNYLFSTIDERAHALHFQEVRRKVASVFSNLAQSSAGEVNPSIRYRFNLIASVAQQPSTNWFSYTTLREEISKALRDSMNASLNELFISVQPWINDTTALSEANTFYGNRLQLRSEALGSVVPKLLQTIRSGKPFAFDSPLVEGNYPRVLLAAGLLMEKPCDISLVDAAASSWVRGAIEEIGRTGRAPVMPPLIAAIERRNTSTREIYEMIEKGEFTPVVVGRFQRARTLLGVP